MTETTAWPSTKYQRDPVAFAREVLGVEPWAKQVEILEAVRDHKRVAVRSGHKCGKSTTAAMLALWFYCSFPDARVVMTSVTARQVDAILFREVKKLRAKAKVRIDGEAGELARTGIKAPDFREIVGFTAREAEAVAGISGANLLYLPDEASGIPDAIYEAIEGNRAGGARIAMFSNPTRTEGEFFRAFDSADYFRIHVSSEDSPNVKAGRVVIPGLATREWVEEKRREWGEDSPLFKVRVQGEFVRNDETKCISLHLLSQAAERNEETVGDGPLHIGVDPAGPGQGADQTAIAVRRGQKILDLIALNGLTEPAIVSLVLDVVRKHSDGRERAVVKVDREGPIGMTVWGMLRQREDVDVVGVRASDRAVREPQAYDRVRDELWANLRDWLRNGGAIPEDAKLHQDLNAPEWLQTVTGRAKVTAKDEIRKHLGRSPDRADAVALAVWEMGRALPVADGAAAPPPDDYATPSLDPYGGLSTWGGG